MDTTVAQSPHQEVKHGASTPSINPQSVKPDEQSSGNDAARINAFFKDVSIFLNDTIDVEGKYSVLYKKNGSLGDLHLPTFRTRDACKLFSAYVVPATQFSMADCSAHNDNFPDIIAKSRVDPQTGSKLTKGVFANRTVAIVTGFPERPEYLVLVMDSSGFQAVSAIHCRTAPQGTFILCYRALKVKKAKVKKTKA